MVCSGNTSALAGSYTGSFNMLAVSVSVDGAGEAPAAMAATWNTRARVQLAISPWLLVQYELIRQVAPSVSFPQSHDTERLFSESGQNVEAMKQRYLFAALFSAALMMPIGYEFGFRDRLHVVHSRPAAWEPPSVDLTDFITRVNRVKSSHRVFQEESLMQKLDHSNPSVLFLWKAVERGDGEALVVLNKDPHHRQHFHVDDLYRNVQSAAPLLDVSPEWPMDHLPTPFHYELAPGMGRVMVTRPA